MKIIKKTKNDKKSMTQNEKMKNRVYTISLFVGSLLILFITLVPGENVWHMLHSFILGLFGMSAILWSLLMMYVSITATKGRSIKDIYIKLGVACISIVLFCSLIYVFSVNTTNEHNNFWIEVTTLYQKGSLGEGSGLLGGLPGMLFIFLFGITGARILNILLLFMSVMIFTGLDLLQLFGFISKPVEAAKVRMKSISEERKQERQLKGSGRGKDSRIDIPLDDESVNDKEELFIEDKEEDIQSFAEIKGMINASLSEDSKDTENSGKRNSRKKKSLENDMPWDLDEMQKSEGSSGTYRFPDIGLLNKSIIPDEKDVTGELQSNGQMLVDTLKSFNVQTKIIDICRGPAVTRYELQPAAGVKISKITSLSDDIALNLAASGVRIEAPIPGKAAVGVEIPNKVVSIVKMRELIASKAFSAAESKLTVVLGRDISGRIVTTDLAKMPHLLIAGSTGSGKSVCINSFIISLLYKASPDEVKFLMIDPKVVELGVYNGIPHLLVPVVTDPRKAAGALNWAVSEMLKRYKVFAENNVRDISSYNRIVRENPSGVDKSGEAMRLMPQIVIIIDELSDLMMAAPNDVEDAICRLAQMARAAGMHLVIATQRPSVDVITGIIKANVPSRIALAVSSQVDSRTILDMSGAEKLLGRGDMLFSPIGASKPIRVQGCYVTDEEIEGVVESIKEKEENDYDQNVIEEIENNAVQTKEKETDSNSIEEDPMMDEAIKCVIEAGQASTSLILRRLRLGYARAGRLIDQMEKKGIVGPHEGSKPRQVLINYHQFLEMKNLNT